MADTSDPIGSYNNKPIYSAAQELENCDENNLDASTFDGIANSFHVGLGANPGRGYILMAKDDVDSLVGNVGYQLQIGINRSVDYSGSATKRQYVTFPKIIFVKAIRCYGGNEDETSSMMLVEIADKRILLQAEIDYSYNVRPLVKDTTDSYYPNTVTNTCQAYTRRQILDDIWSHLPTAIAGTAPHSYDYFPGYSDVAERIQCNCISALDAYCETLERFGFSLGYNPITDSFLVVHPDEVSSDHTTLQTTYRPALLLSDKTVYNNYVSIPETLIICFVATYSSDTQDLHTRPFYKKMYKASDVAITLSFTPGVVKYIWGDIDARYPVISDVACTSKTGTTPQESSIVPPVPVNQSILDARAYQLASKYFSYVGRNDIQTSYEYEGCVPFVQNGGCFDITWGDVGGGWLTRIERKKNGPFFLSPVRPMFMGTKPTGAGVTVIRFLVVSSDPTTLTVLGEVRSWDAGYDLTDVPGDLNTMFGFGPPLGVVKICDPSGCYFDEPYDMLFGRMGWAKYTSSLTGDSCRTGYPPYAPVWEVFSLCCAKPLCSFGGA